MTSSIRDPEFLRHGGGTVDGESLVFNTVSRGSLHLRSVVSISEFSKAEASHHIERVTTLHERNMSVCAQSSKGSTEKVELYGELSSQGSIAQTQHFVSCKNVFRIIIEVKDGHNTFIGDSFNACIS